MNDRQIAVLRDEAKQTGEAIEASDTEVKGLRVRVQPSGGVTFSLMYRPRGEHALKRITVGKYPLVKLAEARRKALVLKGEVGSGGDPVQRERDERETRKAAAAEAARLAAEHAGRMTVRQMAEAFLIEKSQLRWAKRYRQLLEFNFLDPTLPSLRLGLAEKAADDLTDIDLDAVLTAIKGRGSPIQARRVYEVLRAMVRWARKKKLIRHDPISAVTAPGISKPRDRVLSVEELRTLWLDLAAWDEAGARGEPIPVPLAAVRALRLQLLLGQRSGEVAGMRKFEISANGLEWTIPGERVKNGTTHTVPLPPLARKIIAAASRASEHPAYTFPVHARDGSGFAALRSDVLGTHVASLQEHFSFTDREGKPAPWTAHDLRRTAATYMRNLGISTEIVALILNHASEKESSVTGRHYDHSEHLFAMREALLKWENTVEEIADGLDPFAATEEDVAELERRYAKRRKSSRLVAIHGGKK